MIAKGLSQRERPSHDSCSCCRGEGAAGSRGKHIPWESRSEIAPNPDRPAPALRLACPLCKQGKVSRLPLWNPEEMWKGGRKGEVPEREGATRMKRAQEHLETQGHQGHLCRLGSPTCPWDSAFPKTLNTAQCPAATLTAIPPIPWVLKLWDTPVIPLE